jgi:tetratricopeptide (TPR) repeat protein
MQKQDDETAEVFRRAETLYREGKLLDAAKLYQANFGLARNKRFVLLRMIEITYGLGDLESCSKLAQSALRVDANQPDVWQRLALSLSRMRRYAEALDAIDQAIVRRPESALFHSNRGIVLAHLGRYPESMQAFEHAIRLDENCADAWANFGYVLKTLDRHAEAEDALRRALKADPKAVYAMQSLGMMRVDAHRGAEGIAEFDRALALQPDDPVTHSMKAEALLWLGDYASGWNEFSWRWRSKYRRYKPDEPYPLWTGAQSLQGKRIMVRGEVGLGDFLMFVRYVEPLQQRGATVLLYANRALLRLFSALPGVEVAEDPGPMPAADYQCPIMELPRAFGTRVDNVPARFPYLRVPDEAMHAWAARLGDKTRQRVGMMWWGQGDRNIDTNAIRRRSMPFTAVQPLLDCNLEFHALQKEFSDADRAQLQADGRVRLHGHELTDFAETAALASQMDLVISIDTSVAHLAGGLGKPLWMLLPYWSDYRWGGTLPQSPWYPDAHLFRQAKPGDWDGVVAKVQAQLRQSFPA